MHSKNVADFRNRQHDGMARGAAVVAG